MQAVNDKIKTKNLDKCFIGGEWRRSTGSDYLSVINPSTEQPIFDVVSATNKDVDAAVAAARHAFDHGPWPRMSPADRAKYLLELAKLLRARSGELAHAWTEQVGVLYAMSNGSREYAIGMIDKYVEAGAALSFAEQKPRPQGAGYLVREPVGVVAAIAPWNAPLVTMLNKIVPALLAGCTVIMKPAPQTPVEAYVIAECAAAAGIPPGVVNLITADRDVSDYLVGRPDVDKVSFTGSLAAGKRIASVCGERIARVTLELGGKSAAIVLDDYDLAAAAKSLASGICMLSGQNCAALTRVIVGRGRHNAFTDLLVKELKAVVVGDPYAPTTQVGPLAMKRQLDQVLSYIAKGKGEGAELVHGGRRPGGLDVGYFVEPTVFANVKNSMTIAQDEIFGPVIGVIPCDDEADAVRIANDSIFGLAGAVFTNDADRAYRVARQMRTGTVAQNGPFADFSIGFGGFKQSGLGREGGLAGILPYLENKTLLLSAAPKVL